MEHVMVGEAPIVPGQSISTGSQYVAQQQKFGPKKSQNISVFGSAKWFWPRIFSRGTGVRLTVEPNTWL
jgi:hypothetical protein